jgi:hypothetical protein
MLNVTPIVLIFYDCRSLCYEKSSANITGNHVLKSLIVSDDDEQRLRRTYICQKRRQFMSDCTRRRQFTCRICVDTSGQLLL